MSSGGGKSGSETTETTLPDWLQQPVQRNIQRAEDLQRLPFMPYRGAEVAAFNPNQVSAFQNNADAARAFGFNAPVDAMGGLPEATQYADGSFGYDSNSLYDQALLDSKAYDPVAWDKYQALFDSGAPSANLPIGNPSAGGGNGGGGGGNNPIDPNMLAIQKLRDDRANATNTSNYTPMGNPHLNASNPMNSPGHPSNYNYTPTAPVAPYSNPMLDQKGATPSVPYSNSRLDSKGYTPTNVSKPIDQIMAEYLEKQAGK